MWFYRPEDEDFHRSLENTSKPFGQRDLIMFREDEHPTDEQGAVLAEALNVHEQTGLTPAQLQARVAELEGALAAQDRVLRSSVPERWKACTSPVGAVQSYISELEVAIQTALPSLGFEEREAAERAIAP